MRADDQDKSAPPPGAGTRAADKLFLGPEFLTWLYFHLLAEGLEIELHDAFPDRATAPMGDRVRFAIGKRTTLRALDGSGARVSITGPGLDESGELLQAVRRGAFIDVLALEMAISERVYSFVLHATDGGIGAVKLPDLYTPSGPAAEEDAEEREAPPRARGPDLSDVLSLRMACLDEVERVVDALFRRFVTRRLARAWVTEDVRAIRRAVAARLAARL